MVPGLESQPAAQAVARFKKLPRCFPQTPGPITIGAPLLQAEIGTVDTGELPDGLFWAKHFSNLACGFRLL
jgi:hypothetical protein